MPDNQGRLSPFTSSSGQRTEEPDNSVEYYVKASKEEAEYVSSDNNVHRSSGEICGNCKFYLPKEDGCSVVSGGIEREAYCKLYVKGGEKMSDKGLDVDESVTTDEGYEPTTSVEPDPESELAMQKSDDVSEPLSLQKIRDGLQDIIKASVVGGPTYTKPAEQEGEGTYSTTANTTTEAPAPGSTTEPSSVHKSDDEMQLCNCMGMGKCVGCACPGCQVCDGCEGETCQGCACEHGVAKAAHTDAEEEDAEVEEDDEEIEKKEFSSARRKQLAREGKAMGDGSYPIENTQDLKNAIRSWGRGGAKPEVKQHIIRRAKALGASDLIPEDWKGDVKKSLWGSAFLPLD